MNIEKLKAKGFKPDTAMITAARAVFLAMAYTESVRPIVDKYQREILGYMMAKPAKGNRAMGLDMITEPKDSWLLGDQDAAYYYQKCHEAATKEGFKLPEVGYCPLLMAENQERAAKHFLIDLMADYLEMDRETARGIYLRLDTYKQFVELSLKLLAPFCGSSDEMLSKYGLKA